MTAKEMGNNMIKTIERSEKDYHHPTASFAREAILKMRATQG
jgi:hypothetical protein